MLSQFDWFLRHSITLAVMCGLVSAEQGILVVQVSSPQDRPIEGVVLATKGDGATGAPTTRQGRSRITLAAHTRAKTWVTLQIIRPRNLVFISPWDKRVQVPSFENESENFVPIVLIERGNRLALESGQALVAMTAKVNETVSETGKQRSNQTALEEVAREFGFSTEEVDAAIRAWGRKTTDPYEKGLAALYERAYPEASKLLAASLEIREQNLREAQSSVGNAALFLGLSVFKQGHYRESAEVFRKALTSRGEDAVTLSYLALSLVLAGDRKEAEPLFRRALVIVENTWGPSHLATASALFNLAGALKDQGSSPEAEQLYRRVLAIYKSVGVPDNADRAMALSNLAGVLEDKGDDAGAEPLYRRALAIFERVLGPNDPSTQAARSSLHYLQKRLQQRK